jgi:glycosyltransferase involved in cell wall biosynthesis
MPIIEAQRVERVCITSNCSSMPEVAGDGACLVDPFSVEAIHTGILRLMEDAAYRSHLIDNGRLNSARFDASEIAKRFQDVCRSILQDCGRAVTSGENTSR